MLKKHLLFFIFLFSLATVLAQRGNNGGIVVSFKTKRTDLSGNQWRYQNGDNVRGADPNLNDSAWGFLPSFIPSDSIPAETFKGQGWFRLKFSVDTALVNQPLCFVINQRGASEIFLNGMHLYSFGVVGTNAANETRHIPHDRPVAFSVSHCGPHTIAIRYSNFSAGSSYDDKGRKRAGFTLTVMKYNDHADWYIGYHLVFINILSFACCLFLVIALMHLTLFLSYRAKKANLYFFLFTFSIALILGSLLVANLTDNPSTYAWSDLGKVLFFPVVFFTLHLLVYSFFRNKLPRILLISGGLALICMILLWIEPGFTFLLLTLVLAPFVCIDLIRNVIIAVRKKLPGAWIIGIGFGLFVLFFITVAIIIIVAISANSNLNMSDETVSGKLLITLFSLGVLSIPISMSIYLARDFSSTNKNLNIKLAEVETLSAKTIEQEKEKQRILEEQKEVLEQQVKERTAEISGQKKVIEEKNKDITDSITYARRIQHAMLPSAETIRLLFPKSFVLFQPKDIVSGDFYWFGTKNGVTFAIMGDCTGHGVPGALMSMIGHNLLDQLILEKGISDPGKILSGLHDGVRQALKQQHGDSETRDGMDVALVAYKKEEQQILFAGANRPLWYIDTANALTEIKGTKNAIGGLQTEEQRIYETHLLPADGIKAIYMTSDGYADQFGGDSGKKFMTKHLKELIVRNSSNNPDSQLLVLQSNLATWKKNREQVDDICIIGICL